MKINIKKIIFFIIIIYGILAGKNMCQAAHKDSCEFCKNIVDKKSAEITKMNISINDSKFLNFGRKTAIATGGFTYYTSASEAGIIKYESQKQDEEGTFYENEEGNEKELQGTDNDGLITIKAVKSGDILLYRKGVLGKIYGYHFHIKSLDDTTNEVKTTVMDDVTSNVAAYKPTDIDTGSASKIESKTSKILTVISNIGIAVSVIILAILGVKYMIGSVEDKAEYKEDMIPYLIGALMLFGITSFLKIIIVIGEKIGST